MFIKVDAWGEKISMEGEYVIHVVKLKCENKKSLRSKYYNMQYLQEFMPWSTVHIYIFKADIL